MTVRSIRGRRRAPAPTLLTLDDWRLPIVDAYDSASADQAALAASSTNKTLPLISVASGTGVTRTIAWRLPAIGAAGALLYFNLGSSTNYTLAFRESYDDAASYAGNTSWSALSWAAWYPSDDSASPTAGRALDRGQWLYLAPGGARWLELVLTNNDNGRVLQFSGGVFDMSAPRPQLWCTASMSIHRGAMTALNVRAQCQADVPGSDPVFIIGARSGAITSNILSNQIQPLATAHPRAKAWLIDPGPNDFISTGTRPYPGGSSATTLQAGIDAIFDYFDGLGIAPYMSNITYGDYPNGLFPNASAAPVNGLTNLSNGAGPFNDNVVHPRLKARGAARCWRDDIDAPAMNAYLAFLENFEGYIDYPTIGTRPAGDGVHPGSTGAPVYRALWRPAFLHAYTGVFGAPLTERLIAAVEPACPAARKTRLQAVLDNLPATASPPATAARSVLQSRITALSTAYAQPAGWDPSNLTPDLWLDPANWNKVTYSGENLVTQLADSSANAFALEQTGTGQPFPYPTYTLGAVNRRAALTSPGVDGGTGTLVAASGSAALNTLMDGLGDFTLWWLAYASAANQYSPFGWSNVSLQTLSVGQTATGYGMRCLINNAAVLAEADPANAQNVPFFYILRRSGSALTLIRNGTQTASGTSATAIPTSTAFRLMARGANSNQWRGGLCEMGAVKRAISAGEQADLIAYGLAKYGT